MAEEVHETFGDGYAVGHIDGMGEGPGFRKLRQELGVTAFGVNVIVLPPAQEGKRHYHERQEEIYFVHRGHAELEFGDGATHLLGPGGAARVEAQTVRVVRNPSDPRTLFTSAPAAPTGTWGGTGRGWRVECRRAAMQLRARMTSNVSVGS